MTGNEFGCPICGQRVADALRQLALLIPEISITLAKLDRISAGDGPRPDGAEAALPYRLDASDRGRAIQGELVTWARVILDETGAPLPEVITGSTLAHYLAVGAARARGRAFWREYHDALLPLARVASRIVDRPAERVYLGPCGAELVDGGTCMEDVTAPRDAAYGRCRGCGTEHDYSVARAWMLDALQDVLVTTDELRDIFARGGLTVGRSSLYRWIASGQLVAKGTRADRPTYRVGDALDVQAAAAVRNPVTRRMAA
ncbi:hypothetical protein [Winogradskya humida]|uniref:hypothetical protein n=1 Tax=Winogradskya humida TaxID=113566 RepID=UPI0031CFE925